MFIVYLLSGVDMVIRYIEVVDSTFGPRGYVHDTKEFVIFVISRFYSIPFTVTLAGT